MENNGGSAFPGKKLVEKTVKFDEEIGGNVFIEKYEDVPGMTLRAYAAIKLRVPVSGIDWLDAMIQKSRLDEFAGKAMAGVLANDTGSAGDWIKSAKDAILAADAMLAERRGKTYEEMQAMRRERWERSVVAVERELG